MKKLKYLLLSLIMFMPFVVKALDYESLPDTISTEQGLNFVYNGAGNYFLYVSNDVSRLDANYDFGLNTFVVGSNTMIVDGFNSVHKIMVYYPPVDGETCNEETCEKLIVTLNVTKESDKDSVVKLNDLEVAGFDINFSNKKTDYVVYVPTWTDSVYVYADYDDALSVSGTGIIDLEKKGSTKIEVYVHNTITDKTFTITVKKRNPYIVFYVIIALLIAAIIGIVIYFMNANKKIVKVGDIKNVLDKIEVPKKDEKKDDVPAYEQPIANENLKSGILTPRNMILPEEETIDKK